jgi:hypothetical protein
MTRDTEISDSDIIELRDEAGVAGDRKMVVLCDRALDGNQSARGVCAQVIRDAADAAWEDR